MKKALSKLMLAMLFATPLAPHTAHAQISDKAAEAIDKAFGWLDKINLDIKLNPSVEIINGATGSLTYRYTVEPSYYGTYYSRRDSYMPQLGLNLADILKEKNLLGKIEAGLLLEFIRHYPKAGMARKIKNGYLFTKYPNNAEKALSLEPGDYAIASGFLNIVTGATDTLNPFDNVGIIPTAGLNKNGSYKIFIFRGDDTKVRVRLVGTRKTFVDIEGHVGWRPNIFGISTLNKMFHKISRLTELVSVKKSIHEDSKLFLADFTLDMSDAKVQAAYNTLFEPSRRMRVLKAILNPTVSNQEIHAEMLDLIRPLNSIHEANPALVERNFQGSSFASDGSPYELAAGITGLITGKRLGSKTHYDLTRVNSGLDTNGNRDHFSISTFSEEKKFGAIASAFGETHKINRILVNEADEDFNATKLRGLGFYYDYTDKRFYGGEGEASLRMLQKVLPEPILNGLITKMQNENWYDFKGRRRNVRVNGRLFLKEAALLRFLGTTSEQIENKLIKHMESLANRGIEFGSKTIVTNVSSKCRPYVPPTPKGPVVVRDRKNIREYFCRDIAWIGKHLGKVLDRSTPPPEREEYYALLGKSPLFLQIGLGFMLSDLSLSELDQNLYFDLNIFSSLSDDPFYYVHGTLDDLQLYDIVVDIMRFMMKGDPDMRIIDSIDSLTTRRAAN